jgi:hypothetical protein
MRPVEGHPKTRKRLKMTTRVRTIVELPADMRDMMHMTANKGLMVHYINADLMNRAHLDVRESFVFYDDAGLFEMALSNMLNANALQRLYDHSNIRFWSKGI